MERSNLQCQSRPPMVARSEDPWLVYSDEGSQTFYSLSEGCSYDKAIPELSSCYLVTCSHGWMVMVETDNDDNCFLWNPVSMNKIKLPQWGDFDYFRFGVLTSPPNLEPGDDNNCFVVVLSSEGRSIMFCRPGDREWTVQVSPFEDNIDHIDKAVTCGGKIYGILRSNDWSPVNAEVEKERGNLICIDVEANRGQSNPRLILTQLWVKDVYIHQRTELVTYDTELIESCGEVYRVIFWYMSAPKRGSQGYKLATAEVVVYRLDSAKMVWEKVNSLGDNRAFLIGGVNTFSCPATRESRMEADCIYYTSREDRRKLYRFNIKEQSFAVSLPCPNVMNTSAPPNWIVPHI